MELDLGQKLRKNYHARKEPAKFFMNSMPKLQYVSANDRLAKIERCIEKSSNCSQKTLEKNDELENLSMHSSNAADTINQLEFYLGSITAKMTM